MKCSREIGSRWRSRADVWYVARRRCCYLFLVLNKTAAEVRHQRSQPTVFIRKDVHPLRSTWWHVQSNQPCGHSQKMSTRGNTRRQNKRRLHAVCRRRGSTIMHIPITAIPIVTATWSLISSAVTQRITPTISSCRLIWNFIWIRLSALQWPYTWTRSWTWLSSIIENSYLTIDGKEAHYKLYKLIRIPYFLV